MTRQRYWVGDDTPRLYDPLQHTTKRAVEIVLDAICDGSPSEVSQRDIRSLVADRLGVKMCTANVYTSAGLLYLREEGMIECTRFPTKWLPALWRAL